MLKRFGLGFAAGYVLGSRGGEKRYEQITRAAHRLTDLPGVQELVDKVPDAASNARQRLIDVVRERGLWPGSDSGRDADADDDSEDDSDERRSSDRPGKQLPSGRSRQRKPASGARKQQPSGRSRQRKPASGARKQQPSGGSSGERGSLGGLVSAAYERGRVA